MLPNTPEEIAAGGPWVRSCGCDCWEAVHGVSHWDHLKRVLSADVPVDQPGPC